MTSSMLTGERRWTSARRGGMTVLGKVAVPKPLNLPSQRLENHGLNLDAEIVRKGTHSWGSKTSSSTPNAWASSTLSPNADGGTGSPSHLSACLSSGGNGSRPSTAGSDRTHEPSMSAWGANSRPSSASGALSSSQASSSSLRPRSAETRPGSSQLSRFAETSTSHPTWGAGTSAERLGILNSKSDGFSLSSGDFPTLGSEKDNPGKTSEPQGHSSHGCPSSPSAKFSPDTGKTDVANSEQDVKNGAVGMWRRDGPHHVDDGMPVGVDVWQGEPHQYANSDAPHQHFDAWHGPPMPPPTGVWYRGHPGAPAYGPPVGPGGFQIEPFPYYRSQIPHLANSQPVPPPVHGPRGHHPRSNDMYRAQVPNTYARPGMPFRPGYYPGPVAFEGYYGPPMGYCNSSERDISLMGMPPGPTVFNRYPAPNAPDTNNSHARAGSHGPSNIFLPEQMESAHPDYARQPYKVLLKQHDECDRGDEGEHWRRPAPANTPPHGDRICHPGISSQRNEWGVHSSEEEDILSNRSAMIENSTSHSVDNHHNNSSDDKFRSVESKDNARTAPDNWDRRPAPTESSPGMAQVLPVMQRGSDLPAGKETTLMKKIEGLNAKVRTHDGHFDPLNEEQSRPFINAKVDTSIDETKSSTRYFERTHGFGIHVSQASVSTSDMSRISHHGSKGKSEHSGKAKFSYRDDGWRKQPIPTVFSSPSTVPASNVQSNISYPRVEDIEHNVTSVPGKDEKESIPESFDSVDGQTQRAKREELAKRALQLQKEEEERTREQRAKALAKLEELNRRMQGDERTKEQKEEDERTREQKPQALAKLEELNRCMQGDEQTREQKEEDERTMEQKPQALTKLEELNQSVQGDGRTREQKEEDDRNREQKPDALAKLEDLNQHLQGDDASAAQKAEKAAPLPSSRKQERGQSTLSGEPLLTKPDDVAEVNEHTLSSQGGEGELQGNSADLEPIIEHGLSLTLQQAGANNNVKLTLPSNDRYKRTTGYKQRQNVAVHKDLSRPSAPVSTSEEDPKNHINESTEPDVGPDSESNIIPIAFGTVPESILQHQRRKGNNRSGKNKQKMDDTPAPHGKDTESEKNAESEVSKASQQVLDISSVQAPMTVKQTPEHHVPLSGKEGHNRVNDQRRPQQSRRTSRNQRGNRFVDKSHGSDAVVWAPVQPQTKHETDVQAGQKNLPDPENATQINNSKSKRAEMERYVPKPVAKELAQQGSGQHSPAESTVALETVAESREGKGKANISRQGRAWSQHSSAEVKKDVPSLTSRGTSVEKSDQTQYIKPEMDSSKSLSMSTTGSNLDGWGMPIDSPAQDTSFGAADEGTTGKGNWNSTGDYTSTVKARTGNKNSKNVTGRNSDIKETDRRLGAAKENRVTANRGTSSQWKPKSHVPPQVEKNEVQDEHDLSVSENKTVSQEPRREGKQHSYRGRAFSSNQPSVGLDESVAAMSAQAQRERRFTPSGGGFRRGGGVQNNRVSRGQESSGDWSSGQDDDQQQHNNFNSNRERRRTNNMQYEYQPVGQHNKSSNFGGPSYSSQNVGTRYRETGQSRRGGGNFHERRDSRYD